MQTKQRADEITVRRLTREDIPVASKVLAGSLVVEPGYVAIMPNQHQRLQMLTTMFRGTLAESIRHQAAWGAFDNATLLGVAEWLPPTALSSGWRGTLRMLPHKVRMLMINFRHTYALAAEDRMAERYFPQEPVWYLLGLGVAPQAQGRGVGSRLIQPGLEAARQTGVSAYLETGTEQNVRFYSRFGFEVIEPAARLVPDGPTHWTMIRRHPMP